MNNREPETDMFEWPVASSIDLQTYPRRGAFEHYMGFEIPVSTRTVQIDITLLKTFIKDRHYRFSLVLGFILTRAVNHVPELRHRILNDELVEYDKILPSFTLLSKDKRVFFSKGVFSDVFSEDYQKNLAINDAAAQGLMKNLGGGNLGHIYIGNNPWTSFTSLNFPYVSRFASVPVFGIGKFYEESGRIQAPLAIQNHHGLADGYHIAHCLDVVQKHLDDPNLIDNPFVSNFK